ncbi:MAG: hypothetical protein J2P30_00485 [Actinobacteria bacterium]|nr:hypothetical protein [Actinomycetota bacterium]
MPQRTAGKRGRKPVKPPAERFAIKYVHEYAREPLPAPSYPVDATGGIAPDAWLMLGNGPDPTVPQHPDGVGDCGYAAREHYRMAKAACNGEHVTLETAADLVAEYLAYDHGRDEGVVLADVLLAWYKAGKILGFAPVKHTDKAQADSAMQAFHGVLTGVSLTDDAEDLFDQGQPWTLENGEEPDPTEGHAILKVWADGAGYDKYITWGQEQEATENWTSACTDEMWVIITSEDSPVDLAALRADIDALHGTGGGPSPAPAPPAPPPPLPEPPAPQPPSPEPPDVFGFLRHLAQEILHWLERNHR